MWFQRLGARCIPSLVAALLYGVFVVLWRYDHASYVALQMGIAFMGDPQPFNDLNAILQASACAQKGVNVYVVSSCMHGGVFNYSPFLLRLWPGLGPDWLLPFGIGFGVLFLAAACLLPPAQGARAIGWRSMALCSGTVVWALETANLDCLLFVLCVIGLCWVLAGRVWGGGGYALFAFCGALKFYPAILLTLCLRESRRRFAIIAVMLAVAGGIFVLRYGHGLATALAMLPAGLPFHGVFGAFNWAFGLMLLRFEPVLTLEPHVPEFLWALHQPGATIYMVIASRLLVVVGLYTAWRLSHNAHTLLAPMPAAEKLFLVAGALIVGFCFFIAQNLQYRAIFLLFTLPALARVPAMRWFHAAVMLLLWEGMFRHAFFIYGPLWFGPRGVYIGVAFWLFREYIWWFVVVRLTAIAFAYLRIAGRQLLSGAGAAAQGGV